MEADGTQISFQVFWELKCLTPHSPSQVSPLVKKPRSERVQSQPLPSLLEPWTSGVEQSTVQHPHFRDEETEALGKAKTCLDQPELGPRSLGTEANALLFTSG